VVDHRVTHRVASYAGVSSLAEAEFYPEQLQSREGVTPVCVDHFVAESQPTIDPSKRAVIIRDGKLIMVDAFELNSDAFLFEYDADSAIVPRLVDIFAALMGSGVREDARFAEVMLELKAELDAHLSGQNVKFESLNELISVGQDLTSSIAETRKKIGDGEDSLSRLRMEGIGLSVSASRLHMIGTPAIPGAAYSRNFKRISALKSELAGLENLLKKRMAMREDLGILLADVVIGSRATGDGDVDAVAFGTAGALLEQIDLKDLAREHYESASRIGKNVDNPLIDRYFELQAIRMMPEVDDAWEEKVERMDALITSISSLNNDLIGREILVRDEPIFIKGIRATEAITREIGAQALMEKIAIYRRNDLDADDDIFEELHSKVMMRVAYAAERPASQAEAGYLAMALAGLTEARVELIAEQSKMADLEELETLLPLIRMDAERTHLMIDSFDELEAPLAEAYTQLLKVSYFLPEQQCGLPLDAIESWMRNVDSKFPNAKPISEFTNYLRESAPHLFNPDGSLKGRYYMPDAPDALAAIDAEGALHILAGTMKEGIGVSVSSSMAGAYGLGKAGILCGPAAEVCIPLGAAIGGAGGFLFGEKVLHWMHDEEIDRMEFQVGKAGLALARITPEEASTQRLIGYGSLAFGTILSGVGGRSGAGFFGKMVGGARALGKKQTYINFGRWMGYQGGEFVHELRYGKNVLFATGHAIRGILTKRAPKGGMAVLRSVDDIFDDTFRRLSPGQRALLGETDEVQRAAWRKVAESLVSHKKTVADDLVSNGFKKLTKAQKALLGETEELQRIAWRGIEKLPQMEKVFIKERLAAEIFTPLDKYLWSPINNFVDKKLGFSRLNDLWLGRVNAAHMAIRKGAPEALKDRTLLMFRKELLTHQSRIARGWTPGMKDVQTGIAKFVGGVSDRITPYTQKLFSQPFARMHRLGTIPATLDLFYDGDGKDVVGGGWTLSDGDIDTWWGFGGLVTSTGYYSTRLGINSIYGADIAGTAKALTFASFLGVAGQEAMDVDFNKLSWAQLEYLAILPTTLMLYSGVHASGSSRLMMTSTALPFLRRVPSLSSPIYRSAFKLTAPLSKPAMQGVWGRGLSLGYTIPYIMGVTYLFSKKLDADPYFVGQRGFKFAAVGLILNPLMVQLGGKTAIGQGVSRMLGYGFDIIPALSMSPYYNKGVFDNSLERALGSENPDDQDLAMDIFMSRVPIWGSDDLGESISTINRTYDVGGFMSAFNKDESFEMFDSDTWLNPNSHFDIADPSTYSTGWRWEPQALIKWLDVMDELVAKKIAWAIKVSEDDEVDMEKVDEETRAIMELQASDAVPTRVYERFLESAQREFESTERWMDDDHYKRGVIMLALMIKLRAVEYRNNDLTAAVYKDFVEGCDDRLGDFLSNVPEPAAYGDVKLRDDFKRLVDDIQDLSSHELDEMLAPLLTE